MTARVVIVQPYVPEYRVAFFTELRERLLKAGVECVVAAGTPRGSQAARGDAVRPDWLVPVRSASLTVGQRSIDFGMRPAPWKHTDAVILGLEGSSLPVYRALFPGKQSRVKVGLWGHVRPYVASGNSLDLWLEKHQMRSADHIFAYTPGGHEYALARGVKSNQVTTVMNTVDTTALENARDELDPHAVYDFCKRLDVNVNRTLCFVGGLDASKRIDFLAATLDHLWANDQTIKILIGGNGPHKDKLDRAMARGQAIDLGYLDTAKKALVIAASRMIAMPGRIGLVAVDALVMQKPVATTAWKFHAPEVEYLVENISRLTSIDEPEAYANMLQNALQDDTGRAETQSDWKYPSLNDMVTNFQRGLQTMLERP